MLVKAGKSGLTRSGKDEWSARNVVRRPSRYSASAGSWG